MKTIAEDLRAALAQDTTTIATAWRVIRADGLIFGFTDHDEDAAIDGIAYVASEGLQASSTTQTDTLQIGSLDCTVFLTVPSGMAAPTRPRRSVGSHSRDSSIQAR